MYSVDFENDIQLDFGIDSSEKIKKKQKRYCLMEINKEVQQYSKHVVALTHFSNIYSLNVTITLEQCE